MECYWGEFALVGGQERLLRRWHLNQYLQCGKEPSWWVGEGRGCWGCQRKQKAQRTWVGTFRTDLIRATGHYGRRVRVGGRTKAVWYTGIVQIQTLGSGHWFSTICTLEGASDMLLGGHPWGGGWWEGWDMCHLKRALHSLNITHHKMRSAALDDPLGSLGIWGHLHLLIFIKCCRVI